MEEYQEDWDMGRDFARENIYFKRLQKEKEKREEEHKKRREEEKPLPTVWIQYYKKDSFNYYENKYPAFTLQRIHYWFRQWDFGFANSLDSARFIVFCIPVETLENMLSHNGSENTIRNTLKNMSYNNIHRVCILAFTNSDDETGTYYIPKIFSNLQVPIHVAVYFESLNKTIIKTNEGIIDKNNILKRTL